jgi:hypothetical protein
MQPDRHEPLWSESLWKRIKAVRFRRAVGREGGTLKNTYPLRSVAARD